MKVLPMVVGHEFLDDVPKMALAEKDENFEASRPPNRSGHHVSSCLTKVFKDCLKAIGVERRFSSHGLRRTANNILRKLYGGETARAITGHVTVKMTEHYSHVNVEEKRAAVEGDCSAW
jgi:integrase